MSKAVESIEIGAWIDKLEPREPWLIVTVRRRPSWWRVVWLLVRYRIRVRVVPPAPVVARHFHGCSLPGDHVGPCDVEFDS